MNGIETKRRTVTAIRTVIPARRESISGFCGGSLLTLGAGTDGAKIVVGIDAGGVAIREADLDSVVPYLRGGLAARLGLEHRERRRRCERR